MLKEQIDMQQVDEENDKSSLDASKPSMDNMEKLDAIMNSSNHAKPKYLPVYGHILTADQWPNKWPDDLKLCIDQSADYYPNTTIYQYPEFPQSLIYNYKKPKACIRQHIIGKLSVDLMNTYKNINEVYYKKKQLLDQQNFQKIFKDNNNSNRDNNSINNYHYNNKNTNIDNNTMTNEKMNKDRGHSIHVESKEDSEIIPNPNIDQICLPSSDVQSLFSSIPGENAQINNNYNSHDNLLPQQSHNIESNIVINTTLNSTSNNFSSTNDNDDNRKNNELLIRPGEIWMNQYCIDKFVGTGSFGEVLQAKDLNTGESVAIKIIKDRRVYFDQAQNEIRILHIIGSYQKDDEIAKKTWANYIVKLKTSFTFQHRLCLVFELLTCSLYDLLRNTGFRGVSLNLTRKFGQQLCSALVFLTRTNIVHCDLKPENILLVHPRRSAIKIIDFGSSCIITENKRYYYIQSRFYRSPEIILGLDYSHPIDMWSLGCILVELHTGQPLFIGQFEHEQMLRIIEVVGMPSAPMIMRGNKGSRYFVKHISYHNSPSFSTHTSSSISSISPSDGHHPHNQSHNTANEGLYYKPRITRFTDDTQISFSGVSSRHLSDIIGVYHGGPQGRRANEPGHEPPHYLRFLDLLHHTLKLDPKHRILPQIALQHQFFSRRSTNTPFSTTTTTTATTSIVNSDIFPQST